MSEILCYQHGLYPRSEDLVAATNDVDRGRRPAAAVIDQRESDRRAFVTLQRETGLDHVSSGFLSSQDLIRPLVDACAGLATGPLTRWFDNNTFIRTPWCAGSSRSIGRPSPPRTARSGCCLGRTRSRGWQAPTSIATRSWRC